MAAGRPPNTETLNPDAAGRETRCTGSIEANERLETSAPGVYALGDVKGDLGFTHLHDDFRIIRTNLLEGVERHHRESPGALRCVHRSTAGRIGSPRRLWTRPRRTLLAKMPMNYVSRVAELGETRAYKGCDRRRDRPDPGLRGARYRRRQRSWR